MKNNIDKWIFGATLGVVFAYIGWQAWAQHPASNQLLGFVSASLVALVPEAVSASIICMVAGSKRLNVFCVSFIALSAFAKFYSGKP